MEGNACVKDKKKGRWVEDGRKGEGEGKEKV